MNFYSDKDLDKVCRSYSKDWDKLNQAERSLVRQEAEKWLKAFQKVLPEKLFKQN
jgi:hypothetical protein